VSKVAERKMTEWENKQNTNIPSSYNCQILLEKTTLEQAKDISFPNDAYLIWYTVEGSEQLDLVRGSRVRIFDMYYDKYGPGSIQKIDFGYGRVNPKLWGYKAKEDRKKRK
jgi:hypothetical protein